MVRFWPLLLVAIAGGACGPTVSTTGPRTVQPGAPGTPSRVVSAEHQPLPTFNDADVKFMQGMIGHHGQALEMTALLYTHTTRPDMQLLAKRIDVSQTDEIKMMKRWLTERGQDVPMDHAMHMHGATLMPGMLSEEEMTTLAAAHGPEFDRLFLEGMIKHHGGALVMVKDLFATAGAGQDVAIFAFASDVEADQQAEIDRMRHMLEAKG